MSTTTIPRQRPPVTASTSAPPLHSVRWALARSEGRRLLRHPLFILGFAFALFAFALDAGSGESIFALAGGAYQFIGFGLGGTTFLAACLAANRERRDAAEDLHAAAPLSKRVRTEAALLSIAWAGLACTGLTGIAALGLAGLDGVLVIDGQRYALRPVELVQGPLYIVFAGTLGVLVGRWTRRTYPAVVGALVLLLPPVVWLPWIVFGDGVPQGYSSDWLDHASVGWHVIGLVGMVAVALAGARARHDRRRRVALLFLVGLGAGVAGIALGLPTGADPS